MAYISAAELRAYIGATSTADDTQLGFAATRGQSAIETYTNRIFECPADTTRKYNALDIRYGGNVDAFTNTLQLDFDLCQLTSIVNGNGDNVPTNVVVLQPANFTPAYAIKIQMNTAYVWTYTGTPDIAISITGRFAYSITPPSDIIAACLRMSAYLYRSREGTPDSDRALLSTDGVILQAPRMPSDVQQMLEPYRKRS